MDTNELYEELLSHELFTEEELALVTTVAGYSEDTLNDCLFARYGFRSWDQFQEYIH